MRRCGEARRPSQVRLSAPGPPAPLQGLWSTAPRTRISHAQARRARLSIARHRPQPRGFRGDALRLGSHHVSAEVSAISIADPGLLASAYRTHYPTKDLLSNIYIKPSIPLDTFRARAPALPPTRCDLFSRGPCARYIPICPRAPRKIALPALPRHLGHAKREIRRRKLPCYKAS